MTTSQGGKTVIYYTPYNGSLVPLYDGTGLVPTPFAELSNDVTASDAGKAGPAAVIANMNYDLFVWNDAGTPRLTRGAAWHSGDRRSAETENDLQRVNGVLTNRNAIRNGPVANRGTYVGTVRSDGAAQINFSLGAVGEGGVAAVLGVWNAYNRVDVRGFVGNSTDSWTYNSATWRAANGSSGIQVRFVSGLAEDFISFTGNGVAVGSTPAANAYAAVGFDSVSSPAPGSMMSPSSTYAQGGTFAHPFAAFSTVAVGFHYAQLLEYAQLVGSAQVEGTMTWFGDHAGTEPMQTGLAYAWRY